VATNNRNASSNSAAKDFMTSLQRIYYNLTNFRGKSATH